MPEMTLEYSLRKNNIDPRNDVNIDTSIAFAAMSGAFISGIGDYVTLFEPNASMIEKEGYGYIVESVGKLAGNVPYTSFSARKSFLNKNTRLINDFNKSIQMGLDYVNNHSSEEIADIILNQFPDTSKNILVSSIDRYKNIEVWPKTTNFSKESFDHLQDIMIEYGELKHKVPYDKLMYK